jgi:RTX toxin RtxA
VNGPSGSTNIMTFLYLQMQKENPAFNLQDAFAGTMMFLTFDGGHSLPESVGTYRAITSDTRSTLELGLPKSKRNEIMDQRRQVLETSVLAYGELSQLFGHAETAQGVSDAVDRAWARTEQTFEQLHAERLSNPS